MNHRVSLSILFWIFAFAGVFGAIAYSLFCTQSKKREISVMQRDLGLCEDSAYEGFLPMAVQESERKCFRLYHKSSLLEISVHTPGNPPMKEPAIFLGEKLVPGGTLVAVQHETQSDEEVFQIWLNSEQVGTLPYQWKIKATQDHRWEAVVEDDVLIIRPLDGKPGPQLELSSRLQG